MFSVLNLANYTTVTQYTRLENKLLRSLRKISAGPNLPSYSDRFD